MTEEQAREWVAEHDDGDDLDAEEMEHAFAALIGRRPDPDDDQWTLLCEQVA